MTPLFHSGELNVQARAGVASRASKPLGSILPLVAQDFLRSQPLAIAGSQDARGRVWASLLTGDPGFIQIVDEKTVRLEAQLIHGDPLGGNLLANDQLGLLIVDFAARRRLRLNGRATVQPGGAICISAEQVYSNCPQYIQARQWKMAEGNSDSISLVRCANVLSREQQNWIKKSDTFFIASSHPTAGVDASHRGGYPGFVHVINERLLVWPDYSGNKMFQTLGNLDINPQAGLLFMEFESGDLLQLIGKARVIWEGELVSEFAGVERALEFEIDEVRETTNAHRLRWEFLGYSPHNPKMSNAGGER